MGNDRQWEFGIQWEYQINDNNRQCEITNIPGEMADNEELHTMGMTDKGGVNDNAI